MVVADPKWQSDDRVLPVGFDSCRSCFESADENVLLGWTAIGFLASEMKDMVGGGLPGDDDSLATQAVIGVTLRYVGQGL